MNPNRLIGDAKDSRSPLVKDLHPGAPAHRYQGRRCQHVRHAETRRVDAAQGGYISDYDVAVGEKLAHVFLAAG